MMKMNLVIKQLRKEKGLTQEQLSEIMGVSLQTVRRWEWGETVPNTKLLSELAEALGTTPEDLLHSNNAERSSAPNIRVGPTQSKASQETNTGMAVLTLETGRKVEVPATPEGFAFLKDLFAMSLTHTPAVTA